ncbi:type IV secretion/conjugal transfer ATPase, VirB4 family [Klebsiella pneumoniae]|uniref:hypothetical protein n=2 Tax=Klebsiella pneumoniae complex TaxID=3390273 RepID=UPI000E2D7F61|nr:type IV secretion/conjugal transfer ATPase, VirB4 family [Klebsiella pneumoniae]
MMSLWDALRMNMMISYQELVRTFLSVLSGEPQNAEIAHELVERLGNDPELWLKEYWRLTA